MSRLRLRFRRAAPALQPLDPAEERVLDELRARRAAAARAADAATPSAEQADD